MATKKYITKRLDAMGKKAEGNKTKTTAINQCQRWLTQYHWADMQAPVAKEINRLSAMLLALVEEKKKRLFNELEEDFFARHLDTFLIYKEFHNMIHTTAWHAELERKHRQKAA